MKIKIGIIALILLVGFGFFFGKVRSKSDINQARLSLSRRGEVYISFNVNNSDDLNLVSGMVSVEKIEHDTVYAYANETQFYEFLQMGRNYQILPSPSQNLLDSISETWNDSSGINGYFTYYQYLAWLDTLAAKYPDLCQVKEIGRTRRGHGLFIIKVSDGVSKDQDEPEMFYAAALHGNELSGYAMLVRFIPYLLENYSKSKKIREIVNETEIYFCPLANPDGVYFSGDNTIANCTHGNSQGIDLSENLSNILNNSYPERITWQPELEAFVTFFASRNFIVFANLHDKHEYYHASGWNEYSPADNPELSVDDSVLAEAKNGAKGRLFISKPSTFELKGLSEDIFNGREIRINTGDLLIPSPDTLKYLWKNIVPSLIQVADLSHHAIHGKVCDVATKKPLRAKITVFNSKPGMPDAYMSDSLYGSFFLLQEPGNYKLQISCNKYEQKTIRNINIKKDKPLNFSIQLYPDMDGKNFEAMEPRKKQANSNKEQGWYLIYPEICREKFFVKTRLLAGKFIKIEVFNMLGKEIISFSKQIQSNYETIPVKLEPVCSIPGTYMVKISKDKEAPEYKTIQKESSN